MKIRIPRKFVLCRTGVLLLIVAHVLLFLGELIAHDPRHHHCKQIGYGLILGVLLFRTLKAGWHVETPEHSKRQVARKSKKKLSEVVLLNPKPPSPPPSESGAGRRLGRQDFTSDRTEHPRSSASAEPLSDRPGALPFGGP